MESKQKRVLLISVIALVLFGFIAVFVNFFEKMKVQNSATPTAQSTNTENQQKITKEKAIEDKITQLSDTKNWKIFANKYCDISFSYPSEAEVAVRTITRDTPEIAKVCDFSATATKSMLDVRLQFIIHPVSAPVNDEKYNPKKLTEATTKNWSAKQVAEEIAELNKNYVDINGDKSNVSAVEELSINGKNAYFFTIDRGLVDWRQGSHVFDQEVTLVYIADNKGKVYVIEYPSQDKLARLILESLKFTN